MSMSFSQAITALNSPHYQTLDGLRALVRQVSVSVPGAAPSATTLLYSGTVDGTREGIYTYKLAESISASSSGNVVTINQTEAARLLKGA